MSERTIEHDNVIRPSGKWLRNRIEQVVCDVLGAVPAYRAANGSRLYVDRVNVAAQRREESTCEEPVAAADIEEHVARPNQLRRKEPTPVRVGWLSASCECKTA